MQCSVVNTIRLISLMIFSYLTSWWFMLLLTVIFCTEKDNKEESIINQLNKEFDSKTQKKSEQ